MDFPINILEKLDIYNLLAMATMLWIMYSRLDKKLDKLDTRMSKLENDMIEVKTVLRLKECCMIQDTSQMKKAE